MRWMALASLALASPALADDPLPLPPPVPPPPPANCTSAEHRQFDFWIGDWEVFQTAKPDEKVGGSLIEPVYFGCGLRETWLPFTAINGGSLNSYDPRAKRWRQTWIDAQNARVDFEGGMQDGSMVLTGLWRGLRRDGGDALMRMTYTPLPQGRVRQRGETSVDGGQIWEASFDFTYRPARR